ncbi:MAG TPA: nucleotidyltransferase domain-containing protein [Methylococcaceae bacterium]|nr:nucleotidyltransferase domain-containing protein [Methylococcaceae bacterium]
MRLSPDDVLAIRRTVTAMLGEEVHIVLFGSRVDDTAKGGDVDLMIGTVHPTPRPAYTAALLSARLSRVLGGRSVDVVLDTPETRPQAIHEIAKRKGITL